MGGEITSGGVTYERVWIAISCLLKSALAVGVVVKVVGGGVRARVTEALCTVSKQLWGDLRPRLQAQPGPGPDAS